MSTPHNPGETVATIIMYTTHWCPDCVRAKYFLKARGVAYREVNIEEDERAEAIVLKANHGKRKVPTLKVGDRFFACSPFNAVKLASELNVPLNP
jgi:mycoredoxin